MIHEGKNDKKVLRNMMGAEISFIVIEIDKIGEKAVASRIKAMDRIKEINLKKLVVGDKTYIKVIGVWKKYIRVECVGMDFIIKAQDLQYGFVEDVSKLYKINERVKALVREKDGKIIRHQGKKINNRNIVAFDVIMEYLDRNPEIKKGNRPINAILKTRYISYDIIAIKEDEIYNLYSNIDNISSADKVIIIIQTKQYIKRKINTNRECLICTCSPLKIVDKIN